MPGVYLADFFNGKEGHGFPKYLTMLLRVRNWRWVIFPLTIIEAQAFVRPTALPISSKFIWARAHLPVNFLISRMSDMSVMVNIIGQEC